MNILLKYTYLVVFSVLISSIGISTLLNYGALDLNTFSRIENRNPTNAPVWSWERNSIKKYFSQLNYYINDSFSFRDELINFYSLIHFKIGLSINPKKAVIGKKGFVFLGNYHNRVIEQTTGNNLFTNSELQSWNDAFVQRKKYLDQQNIQYYVVIAPDKHSIYPEYLPDYISKSDNNRLQQIVDSKPNFNLINLKPGLINAKAKWGDLLYYKTDSHWTFIGAYLAYVDIIKNLNTEFNEIKPLELGVDNFNKLDSGQVGGNIRMLNITSNIDDYTIQLIKTENWENDIIKTNYKGDTLPFNYLQCITVNEQAIIYNKHKPYTLLLLKDSFSSFMSPFLNQSFGKIIYCHYNQDEGKELTQLVEKHNPDIVISEFVQRTLTAKQTIHSGILFKLKKDNLKRIGKFDNKYLFTHSKLKQQITNTISIDNEFCFHSSGNDPILIFPKVKLPSDKMIVVKIELSVPESTIAQLWYFVGNSQSNKTFHEIKIDVQKGYNTVFFFLPQIGVKGDYLRFDPGLVKGEYKISGVEFFEEQN